MKLLERGNAMKNLCKCLDLYFEQEEIKNIAVRVGNRNKLFCDMYRYEKESVGSSALFDMASVTKIMATATLTLIAINNKLIDVDDCVSAFFEVPTDKKNMTIKNILTHTIGIGHKNLCVDGVGYSNVHEHILNIKSDIAIGNDVLYSCPGYILLGKILEKVLNGRLDELFLKHVANPLGLKKTSFLPNKENNFVNSNLSDEDKGIVNDYNCRFLGGVAGNAGLFSNMDDVTEYVRFLQNHGEPLISKEIFDMAIQNYTSNMSASRGLGFLYVDERYRQTGTLFRVGSIGHCGHTGQSVFVDLESGLYCIILSDANISVRKKYGDERYDIVMKMREDIHNAIHKDLKVLKIK